MISPMNIILCLNSAKEQKHKKPLGSMIYERLLSQSKHSIKSVT